MSRADRRSLDVVVACVRHQLLGVPLGAVWADARLRLSDIARVASRHAVAPLVHAALEPSLDVTSPDAVELERAHLTAVGNHLRVLADLARLAPILESAGAAWAVVKGPVLAEAFFPRAELRSYNDLDVLVDPRQVGDVVEALEARGARLLDVNWPLIRSSGRGEISLVLWHGTVLDLHWNLITERAVRNSFRLNETEMLNRRRHVTVGSTSVPTLGRGDMLVHVALHALLAGGDRLGWFADISAVMRGDGAMTASDWERAEAQRCALAVAIMLDRVQRVLQDRERHCVARGRSPNAELAPPRRTVRSSAPTGIAPAFVVDAHSRWLDPEQHSGQRSGGRTFGMGRGRQAGAPTGEPMERAAPRARRHTQPALDRRRNRRRPAGLSSRDRRRRLLGRDPGRLTCSVPPTGVTWGGIASGRGS